MAATKPLELAHMKKGLRNMGRTPDTLQPAFLTLSLPGEGVDDVELLRKFTHLQVVDLNDNEIEDAAPMGALPHLITLHLANNGLTEFLAFEPPLALKAVDYKASQARTCTQRRTRTRAPRPQCMRMRTCMRIRTRTRTRPRTLLESTRCCF